MDELVFMSVMASLVGGAVWVLSRRRRPADREAVRDGEAVVPGAPASTAVCPACQREFPARMRYCSHDARALVPPCELDEHLDSGVTCGRCDRSFDPATRFCPFDGDELSPLNGAGPGARRVATPGPRTGGKICPSCADRYPADEAFCGRDGDALVALN